MSAMNDYYDRSEKRLLTKIKQLEEDKRLLIKFLEKEESYILDELAEKRVPSYVAILNSIKTELNKHLTP